MDIIRRLLRKKDGRKPGIHGESIEEEEVSIEEADDEYVLLKAFVKEKNPEVAFSYAINRIDELKVAVAYLTKEKEATEKVNAALKDDLEIAFRFKNQIEDLREELMNRERELSEKSIEIETLVRKSARSGVEIDTLKKKMEKKDQQIKNYLKQIEELRQDPKVAQLQKKNRENENKIASLEDGAKNLRVRAEEQKTALSVQGEELEQYKQMAASMDAELNTLKASWWDANTKFKDIKRQLDEKEGIISSKDGMIKNLMTKSKESTSEISALKQDMDVKTQLLSDYEKRSDEFDRKEKELIKQIEEKRREIGEIETKVTEALEKGPRLLEAEKRLEELLPIENDVKKLRIQIEEQKDALNVATSEADQYKQMAASMDAELNSIKANWWEMSKQTKGLKKEIEIKDGIIAAKDNTIKELIEKSRGTAEELDTLKKQTADSAMTGGWTAAPAPPQSSPSPSRTIEVPESPQTSKAPLATKEAQEPAAAKKPAAETPVPKVSPNDSKIKLLEIERRSILKMLDKSGMEDSTFGKKYQRKLTEISFKIKELRRG